MHVSVRFSYIPRWIADGCRLRFPCTFCYFENVLMVPKCKRVRISSEEFSTEGKVLNGYGRFSCGGGVDIRVYGAKNNFTRESNARGFGSPGGRIDPFM